VKRFQAGRSKPTGWVRLLLRWCLAAALIGWLLAALVLFSLRWIDPPFTAVHIERRVQAWIQRKPYHERYVFLRLNRISPDLQHAVIAAEDSRFFQHHGFDWHEIHTALEDHSEDGRIRGASTITQQLVKNLFFGTGRSFVRKGAEFTLVPIAEFGLGKRRILELDLDVVEWGPGIYGAEAASHYHYGTGAHSLGREQAARLAAILPAPLHRRPQRMNEYSELILDRMRQMGW
jgi:monofunctional glycosyltransferase